MDAGLVLAAAGGDVGAFSRLVDDHKRTVCGISLAVVGDLALSEEIAQEVFLTAWQRLSTLRNPHSFAAWLRTLTRNRARDALRRRNVRPHPAELSEELCDPRPTAAERLDQAQALERLQETLSALPDEAREALILFYREGESVTQVAALLELSEAAVKKRLQRARDQLRVELGEDLRTALVESAPGAAFTALVGAALMSAGPATAATSIVAAAPAAATKLALGAGVGVGLSGGFVGVLLGYRRMIRWAKTAEDRRLVLRVSLGNTASMLAFLGLVLAFSAPLPVLGFTWGYLLLLLALNVGAVRGLYARFIQSLAQADPQAAAARDQAERRRSRAAVAFSLASAIAISVYLLGLWR